MWEWGVRRVMSSFILIFFFKTLLPLPFFYLFPKLFVTFIFDFIDPPSPPRGRTLRNISHTRTSIRAASSGGRRRIVSARTYLRTNKKRRERERENEKEDQHFLLFFFFFFPLRDDLDC
eukprot:TRINITY_DN16789_c0_g1_i1.p1 TRINITY_DN16789_c0_g1~~TRINITY_DN16789_c0_g1_i1.p1  ORF type:complete len:119 (-),score=8.32 TRINITY_DN16789_c0_g1_i1:282-638(-)